MKRKIGTVTRMSSCSSDIGQAMKIITKPAPKEITAKPSTACQMTPKQVVFTGMEKSTVEISTSLILLYHQDMKRHWKDLRLLGVKQSFW